MGCVVVKTGPRTMLVSLRQQYNSRPSTHAHMHHRRHCHSLYMTSSPAKLGTRVSPEYTPLTIQQRNNNRKCIYTERVGVGLCLRLSQAANGMRWAKSKWQLPGPLRMRKPSDGDTSCPSTVTAILRTCQHVNLILNKSHRISEFFVRFSLIITALCNRADHYIFALWFLSSFFLLSFFLA